MFFLIFLLQNICAQIPLKTVLLGHSVSNRPIYAEILGEGEENLLLVAGIHANEWVGTPLLLRLQLFIQQNPEIIKGKKVYLVPMLNPDGWVDDMRSNRRRVDLNRNFPSKNYGRGLTGEHPLSEPESQILDTLIKKIKPIRIISIHQPFSCVDYDGDNIQGLVRLISRTTRHPICKLGSRSGSLGAYIGTKYPLITLELPYDSQYKKMSKLWNRYGEALVHFITYPQKFPF